MVDQTWEVREKPILEAIYAAEEGGDDMIGWGTVVSKTGFDEATTIKAVRSLYEGGYITGSEAPTFDGYELLDIHLLPNGRRAIGQWPSDDAFATLIALLDSKIAAESDDNRKSKLESLKGTLRDVGADVAGSVLSAFAMQAAGLR